MKPQNSQKLLVILGPTSSGKTGLAQRLCQKFDGFIISADSRQVYRYLDIGTGKIDTCRELAELRRQRQRLLKKGVSSPADYVIRLNGVDHYMIDLVEPSEDYNVALYQKDAYQLLTGKLVVSNWKLRSQLPFLVGGTGLYIDAIVDGFVFPPGEPKVELRQEIEDDIKSQGLAVVWQRLLELDPACQNLVQKENPRRVARALEYVLSTGRKFAQSRGQGKRQFKVLKIAIKRLRAELYKRIDERVDARLEIGMVREVEELISKCGLSHERLRQFGLEFRVVSDYLTGGFDCEDNPLQAMSQRLKWASHAYARRQLTWFRRDGEIHWVSDYKEAEALVKKFL